MTIRTEKRLLPTARWPARRCLRQYFYRYELAAAAGRDAGAPRLGARSTWDRQLSEPQTAASGHSGRPRGIRDLSGVGGKDTTGRSRGRPSPTCSQAISGDTATTCWSTSRSRSRGRCRWSTRQRGARAARTSWPANATASCAPRRQAVVLERKTSGEDIGPESEYWLRLRCDRQGHFPLHAVGPPSEP